MTIWATELTRIFAENASRTFLIDAIDGGETSYADLARSAGSLAQQLKGLGLRPGDRIGIHLPNGSLFAVLYFACLMGAFTAVPVSSALSQSDRELIIGRARLAAVVAASKDEVLADATKQNDLPEICRVLTVSANDPHADLSPAVKSGVDIASKLAAIENERLFSIHFTSGTTSLPKGVAHKVGALLDNALSFNYSFGIGRDNRFVHVMPMSYMAGFLNTLLGAFTAEASIILAPQFGPQSALRFWEPIAAHRGDTIWMSPTMLATLTHVDRGSAGIDLCRSGRLRIFSATAPLTQKVQHDFESKYGTRIVASYGLSELLLITANDGPAGSKIASVGTILPEVAIEIRDGEGRPVGPGGDGTIAVNTPHAMVGYLDFETGLPTPLADRWFNTGDVGHVDADGYVFVTGRVKDLIIKGGINVSPQRIEEVLLRHPAVQDAAVVGAPHEFYGEQIVAAVITAPGNRLEDIQAGLREICLADLGKSSVPDRFVAFEAFPKTNLGKVQKSVVREMIAGRAST